MINLSMTLGLCSLIFLWNSLQVAGDCQSFGVDFVDHGSYFINTASSDYFNFTSFFEGCEPDGIADTAVMIVSTTDTDYCSEIPTTPDDVPYTAVCNNEANGFALKKSNMQSGEYVLVVMGNNGDGDPFAWQRDITIRAGTQTTLTATPVVTVTIPTTPTITITQTDTLTSTSTADTPTTTLPSVTIDRTRTITPSKVTVYSTKTLTRTRTTRTFTVVQSTTSVPPPCIPWPPKKDLPCTKLPPGFHSPKLEQFIAKVAAAKNETSFAKRQSPRVSDKLLYRDFVRHEEMLAKRGIVRRSPDESTTVVVETTYISTVLTTTTCPATTDTAYATTTTTTTITPPPVTVVKGRTVVHHTVTAPTPTRTRTTRERTTTLSTKTITATHTVTVTTGRPTPCGWHHWQ